jgi:hypothetical protein
VPNPCVVLVKLRNLSVCGPCVLYQDLTSKNFLRASSTISQSTSRLKDEDKPFLEEQHRVEVVLLDLPKLYDEVSSAGYRHASQPIQTCFSNGVKVFHASGGMYSVRGS